MNTHAYLDHSVAVLKTRLAGSAAGSAYIPSVTAPFVTISREAYAGATTVGEALMPMLNKAFEEDGQEWAFFDKNLLAYALSSRNFEEGLAQFLPEDSISEIRATIGELMGLHPSLWQLEHQVAEVILQLAHVGHVVFAGRGAHVITRALPGGLHVRLVAPLETRVRRMMSIEGCDASTAESMVTKMDAARRRHLQASFDCDIDDAHTYDLVINTGRVSSGTAAGLIVEALRNKVASIPSPVSASKRGGADAWT